MNRRKFLKIAGSTGVIVAAAGVGFTTTRTPADALQPWNDARSLYTDPMRRALSYAILAPNPHNRQPWVVDLKGETEAVLTCDLGRLLPETDPFSRQIVIGLGCFLELFSLAARAQGYRADITYFPKGEPGADLDGRPIARLALIKQDGLVGDPLFSQVMNRHTNRNPYDTGRPISSDILERLQKAVAENTRIGTINGGQSLTALRSLTRDAMITEMKTPAAHEESVELMRIGRREIEASPDGISMGGVLLETLNLTGMLTRKNLTDPSSSAFQTGISMMDESAMTAMGFVWINTVDNSRPAQIDAGRAYMRLALQAAAEGLAMQPMSQALQEYPAMRPYYDKVHAVLVKRSGERVQMLARLGYAPDVGPSPRWPLATRMKGS